MRPIARPRPMKMTLPSAFLTASAPSFDPVVRADAAPETGRAASTPRRAKYFTAVSSIPRSVVRLVIARLTNCKEPRRGITRVSRHARVARVRVDRAARGDGIRGGRRIEPLEREAARPGPGTVPGRCGAPLR